MLNRKRARTFVWRKVLAFTLALWRRTPLLVAGCALAMLISSATEVFVPLYAGHLIDAVARNDIRVALIAFGAIAALGLVMVAFRQISWWLVTRLSLNMMRDAGQEAFARIQRFSSDWHADSFSGSTVRRVTRGMWALDTINTVTLNSVLPSLVVLAGTIIVLTLHWPILGLLMTTGAIFYIGFTVTYAMRALAPLARLSNQWDSRIGGVLADAITANAVVKAFGGEEREERRFAHIMERWRTRTRRTWMAFAWSSTGQLAVLWLLRSAITAAALWQWMRGAAQAGEVAYVITSYLVLHGYLRDIGQRVTMLQRAVNEMEEFVLLDAGLLDVADVTGARPIAIDRGEIAFERVTFRYAGQARPLYEDLSLIIPAGQRLGLVGASGSGKTSFIKLIQRLYDISGGRITIDGQDIAHVTQASLRRQIAIVPQDLTLFHRTLAENIGYGRPDATRAEIETAARLANAHDFIMRQPKGYDTLVGERGVKLSGGERQRVAIARAFLTDAPILILDEATSSLDSESEALVQQAIERLMTGRTAIIIAHRLSTVRRMDRILTFDRGRIVEDGDHDALLLAENGHYRRLFDRQSCSLVSERSVA